MRKGRFEEGDNFKGVLRKEIDLRRFFRKEI